jgi:hypothetical protein
MNFNGVLLDTSGLPYAPWRAYMIASTPNPQVAKGAYRPIGWATQEPDTFIIDSEGTIWYFDAVIRLDHNQTQKITQHPVQKGANITDHSYALPAQLTMEIGMSDVMDSYDPGQWEYGYEDMGTEATDTRSVSAYQTLLQMKSLGEPLTIGTRLDAYENMVIATMSAPDDVKTKHGLRCIITFQQIFVATTEEQQTTLRPSVKDESKLGAKQVTDVSSILDSKIGSSIVGGIFDYAGNISTWLKDTWGSVKSSVPGLGS